jgi:hypothetical protein
MREDFDVIVIGAGMAGICCAGELVLHGARPLLIAEGKDVGVALKGHMVDGNRAVMQAPTYQVGWGGGWWPPLVRRLNVPVSVPMGFNAVGYDLFIEGVQAPPNLQQSVLSASGLVAALRQALPMLADALGDSIEELERVVELGLAIPYDELAGLHNVPLLEWLEDQKVDELVAHVLLTLTCAAFGSTASFCRQYASVFGAFGALRSVFCSEATYGFVYPDPREGFAIPVAREVERRGGTVWRGQRVAQLLMDGGSVEGVVMDDGREARAPMVALACGVDRMSRLLDDPAPPEVEPVVRHGERIAHQDVHVFAVLDRPVVPADKDRWIGVLGADGSMTQWMAPLHAMVPWSTRPGEQFLLSAMCRPVDELSTGPSKDEIVAGLHDVAEFYFPGYKDAIRVEDTTTHKSGHLWFDHLTVGPKLPRKSESIDGLWFVNEASVPVYGTFMEAAASAGILGARSMAALRNS